MHERTLHVAELDVAILARRGRKDLRRRQFVPLALEARTAHLAEEQVAKDDKGPGTHVRARLEALARGPRLEKRFLHQIVRQIAASRKGTAEGTQMRNDRRQ